MAGRWPLYLSQRFIRFGAKTLRGHFLDLHCSGAGENPSSVLPSGLMRALPHPAAPATAIPSVSPLSDCGKAPGVLPVALFTLGLSGFAGSRPEAPDQSDDVVGGFAPAGRLRTVSDYVDEVEDTSSTWAADSPRAAPQLLTVAVAKRHSAHFREGGTGWCETDMPSGAAGERVREEARCQLRAVVPSRLSGDARDNRAP